MMTNPEYSMRYCLMNGYNDTFEQKTNMFSEHLRDGDVINDSYMHDAVRFNNVKALQILLDKNVIDTSHKNVGGNTPLHVAAGKGNVECISLLLTHNSNPQADNEKNETPLFKAIEKKQLEAVKILVKVSDVNHQSLDCITPLHLGARAGDLKVIKLLVESGAKLNLLNKEGRNMLHMAVMSGSLTAMAFFIIQNPAYLTAVDSYNRTPAHIAFQEHVIQFLNECKSLSSEQELIAKCQGVIEGI